MPKHITAAKNKIKTKTKKPSMYNVIMLNDDFTTMDFVIFVLKNNFHKDDAAAFDIMMTIHTKGQCVVGKYSYDIAYTKTTQTHLMAKEKGFPLKCIIEKE